MAGPDVRIRFGNPKGVADVAAQIRAQVIEQVAQATVERVQARVDHPAAQTLRARSVNQWSAEIDGPRGGPGPIRPVRARALRFVASGAVVFAKRVMGTGLGPLIEAEAKRVSTIYTGGIRVR